MNITDLNEQIAQQQAPQRELTLPERLDQVQEQIDQQKMNFAGQYMNIASQAAMNLLIKREDITAKDAIDQGIVYAETLRSEIAKYESQLLSVAPVHPSLTRAKLELEAALKKSIINPPAVTQPNGATLEVVPEPKGPSESH